MEDILRSGMLASQAHPVQAAMARRVAPRANASATRARPEPTSDAMDVDFEPGANVPYKVPRPVLAPYLLRKAKLADLTKDEQLARRSVNGALTNPAALASGNAKMLARKRDFDRELSRGSVP